MDDRKAGKSQSYQGQTESDLFDLLIAEEWYQNDTKERLIDEIIVMFFAGMETILISTTQLIQQLTANSEIKKRLLEETYAAIGMAARTSIVKDLTSNVTENFFFTKNCFYESMRLESPFRSGPPACFY